MNEEFVIIMQGRKVELSHSDFQNIRIALKFIAEYNQVKGYETSETGFQALLDKIDGKK
jgi:hypothetical protein